MADCPHPTRSGHTPAPGAPRKQSRLVLCLTTQEGRATQRVASAAPTYARHAPEPTLLYSLIQAHYPDFIARLTAEDRSLPVTVREEFEAVLRCGVLENGFLRAVCEHCHADKFACSEFEQT